MKSINIKTIGLMMGLVIFSISCLMASTSTDIKGTWSYEASQAPIEYSKGKLVISEKEGKLEGVMKVGESSRNLVNMKAAGNELNFGLYLDGEYISVKLKFDGRSFTGTASYTDGTVNLTGKRD